MRHKHAYEGEKFIGSPPEIEMQPYDTGENFGQESAGIVGCRRHTENPARNHAHLVLERGGAFRFAGEEGETVTVVEDDAPPVPGGTVHEGYASLAYGQDSEVCCGGLWW